MSAGRRSDDLVGGVELAALHDEHDQVHLDGQQQAARRGRLLEQHRALQQPVSAGHREGLRQRRPGSPTRVTSIDSGAVDQHRLRRRSTAATRIATTCRRRRRTSPASQAFKVGFQDSWGPYNQNLRANADLYQNYMTNAAGVPAPSTVTLLATPSHWQDRLNANLGFYGQDVMTLQARHDHARRPLRIHQRAGHRPGRADRPLREHPGVRRHPDADAGRASRRARRSSTT